MAGAVGITQEMRPVLQEVMREVRPVHQRVMQEVRRYIEGELCRRCVRYVR